MIDPPCDDCNPKGNLGLIVMSSALGVLEVVCKLVICSVAAGVLLYLMKDCMYLQQSGWFDEKSSSD